ncbi:YdbC family protein [Latilactobacillus curvatus]|uniref:YdbC family protein n=1 Tax=Latilactobacillus curvatus TaxID=28038 RepID=UPI00097702AE|nr:PC4/YdbC family ssDNA-binding protein [Latilactobacillus curvatus]MDG2977144.1 hypothetical protein [Latilactobacillus curvatus]SMH68138.1 conserved hypothetical protein [Latilactobacillus curvatus]
MGKIEYEIMAEIGVLSENPAGWHKELNLISWNQRAPKFDLRDWAPDHAKMGKGVTLSNDEIASLRLILNEMETK